MGISPSIEDFRSLEGYAGKSTEEHIEILRLAGIEINEQDRAIAKFLSTDEATGAFIRGIITVCLDKQAEILQKDKEEYDNQAREYIEANTEALKQKANAYINQKQEEFRTYLEKVYADMNEKERDYYSKVKPPSHLVNSEKGIQEEHDVINYEENNNEMWKELKTQRRSSLTSTYSDTSFSNIINNRFNKNANDMEDVKLIREESTNNKPPMQKEIRLGNKGKELATQKGGQNLKIEKKNHAGYSKNGLNASQHRTNKWNQINVYAGILSNTTRKTDNEIIQAINIENCLDYHLIKMGKKFLRGNQYYVIGFSSDAGRTEVINNKSIINEVGKFMKLTELDKINKRHVISFLNIDSKSNFDIIDNVIEERFGEIVKKINQWNNGNMKNVTMEIMTNCTANELKDTWMIIADEQTIQVKPHALNKHEI